MVGGFLTLIVSGVLPVGVVNPLPVQLSSLGRWRALWRAVTADGYICSRAALAGSVGVLGGVGTVVWRLGGALAAGALWGCWAVLL